MDKGLQQAVAAVGTRYRLSKLLNLSPTSVLNWTEVPIRRVLEVEAATGVDREILRPDLFKRKHKG
jgi:DNA-binding transcriptional regulator YdaS (Cro superfamily)